MSLLRRSYHRRLRYQQRFYVALVLTVIAVSYVAVPLVVRVVASVGHYDPAGYEPKDLERGQWIERRGGVHLSEIGWSELLKVVLVVLTGVAWMAVGPGQSARSRSRRR